MSEEESEVPNGAKCIYVDLKAQCRCTECGLAYEFCTCLNPSEGAHKRLWSPEGRMLRAVREEVDRAREKFPSNEFLLPALVEEVGELSQALIELERNKEGHTAQDVLSEAIQVAAMAIRIGVEGDEYFSYDSDTIFLREE